MHLIRKTLVLGCALAIAACAQSGLNLTPSGVVRAGCRWGAFIAARVQATRGFTFFKGASPLAGLLVVAMRCMGRPAPAARARASATPVAGSSLQVTPKGKETVLYRFTDVVSAIDAAGPQAPLVNVGGTLYGTSPNCTGNGCGAGTVFATPSGSERVVYHFTSLPSNPKGYPLAPYAPVTNLNGTLYGTTDSSSQVGFGTVYALPK